VSTFVKMAFSLATVAVALGTGVYAVCSVFGGLG
jgi:hypothetical protein